jgi:hypothetical protein
VSNDDEFGFAFLNEGGNVVKSKLEVDGLGSDFAVLLGFVVLLL